MPDSIKPFVDKAFNDALANLAFAASLCPDENECAIASCLAKLRIVARTMSQWFQGANDFYSVSRLSGQPYPPEFAWTLHELREELASWVDELDISHADAITSASNRAMDRFRPDDIAMFVRYPHRHEIESELSRKCGVTDAQAKSIVDRAIETNRVALVPEEPGRLHEESQLRLRPRADWIDA